MSSGQLFDVLEVNIHTLEVTLMAEGKTKKNADAIERFAVHRRMTDSNFFVTVPAGSFSNCDKYQPIEVE